MFWGWIGDVALWRNESVCQWLAGAGSWADHVIMVLVQQSSPEVGFLVYLWVPREALKSLNITQWHPPLPCRLSGQIVESSVLPVSLAQAQAQVTGNRCGHLGRDGGPFPNPLCSRHAPVSHPARCLPMTPRRPLCGAVATLSLRLSATLCPLPASVCTPKLALG